MTRLFPIREADVQRAILDYLQYRGYWVLRVNAGAFAFEAGETTERRYFRSAPKGCPDILACSPTGRFVAIEVKASGKRHTLTDAQTRFLSEVERRGGLALCVESLDEVIAAIVGE